MRTKSRAGNMVHCLDESCGWMNYGPFDEAKALAEEHERDTGHPVAIDVRSGTPKWRALD